MAIHDKCDSCGTTVLSIFDLNEARPKVSTARRVNQGGPLFGNQWLYWYDFEGTCDHGCCQVSICPEPSCGAELGVSGVGTPGGPECECWGGTASKCA